jgi:hypothetical protein
MGPKGAVVVFWKNLRKNSEDTYKPGRLVDYRQNAVHQGPGTQIICDIDKTYLETEFESIRRMVRIAFEDAKAKVTVAGASDFLDLARWYSFFDQENASEIGERLPRPLHFVSSSPPQLRSVLEEKMIMDHIDWTSATFKNQAYNIKMGRMDLLRQHVAYKTLAILAIVSKAEPGTSFVMVGDNAETDAYIYLGIKLLAERQLSAEGLKSYLEIAGVESAVAAQIFEEAKKVSDGIRVSNILIRSIPGYPSPDCPPLTGFISYFADYFDASLLLLSSNLIDPTSLWQLFRRFHNQHGYSISNLGRRLRVMKRLLTDHQQGEELIRQIDLVLQKTNMAAARPEDPASETFKEAPQVFEGIKEEEILRSARIWMQMIRKSKEH